MSRPPPPRGMVSRLSSETSPYLLQHAGNPVDWYPWGEEAFTRAEAENKPIFLSVGYSSCHWCHVMERESFEDASTADLLNHYFVSIKVDREERPDVDAIYQLVLQLGGRGGGWPLSVFLLPDRRPFFGGTYFPPAPRHGLPGFREVLTAVAASFRDERWKLVDQAREMSNAIRELSVGKPAPRAASNQTSVLMRAAATKLASHLDPEHHGFGTRPKFPNSMALSFLLRMARTLGREKWSRGVHDALSAMRRGGIWDQLGGGFHRYSTDERWLVPHFEKMLYDNALLLGFYADAARGQASARYADTAAGIVSYLDEITEPTGGWAAAEDADSEGREGRYFVWTPAEIGAVLDGPEKDVALACFGVTEAGNFDDHGVATRETVLHEAKTPTPAEAPLLERARTALRVARNARERPFRDCKVITAWNALAIASLTEAALVFDRSAWLAKAEAAFARVYPGEPTLPRYTMAGVHVGTGFLDDYAYLGEAAFLLHGATGTRNYLQVARKLADAMLDRFWDSKDECFYGTPPDPRLLARPRETFDQAVPSPVAVACKLLLRLSTVCDAAYAAPADTELSRLFEIAARQPLGMSETLAAVDRWRNGNDDVVLVGTAADETLRQMARAAFRAPLRNANVVWLDPGDPRSVSLLAATAEGKSRRGTAFVCRDRTCSLPLEDLAAFERAVSSSCGGAQA